MSWWHSLRHAAADVVTAPGRVESAALRTVGLKGLANDLDQVTDQVDEVIGGPPPEKQLGETNDPTELIHGDPSRIQTAVGHLKSFASGFDQIATGLKEADTQHWRGAAADAFRSKFATHPERWANASTACSDAAGALDGYAQTLTWAQGQAREAIALWNKGKQATTGARNAYNQQVSAYNSQATAYNNALRAGANPGTKPAKPAAFVDPGATDRTQAQTILSRARTDRDHAATQAAATIRRATDLAPKEPSFLSQVGADLSDAFKVGELGQIHFAGGFARGAAGLLAFARSVNPTDPYNLTHPGAYLAGLDSLQAGFVHLALHPSQAVPALLGSGWRHDPFDAAGNLTANLAAAALTDGGSAGEDVAASAGRDAAESAGRDALGDADHAAIPTDEKPGCGDPVDVASGDVFLTHTDLSLPGAFPLVLERTHTSSYRLGQWFGPSWASTFDQRLEVDSRGVVYVGSDGSLLSFAHPELEAGGVAWPLAGRHWALRRTEGGGYMLANPYSGQVMVFELHAGMGIWPITWMGDRAGHRIFFAYTPDGRPEQILHSAGYRVRVTTGDDGRVHALHLATGEDDLEVIRYGYTDGHLSEVINSSGEPLRFTYDPEGRLTSWTDRNEVSYRYTYDGHGRAVRGDGPGGAMSGTFTYQQTPSGRRVTTFTDAAGARTRYEITERGRISAVTDPGGNTTRTDWDEAGHMTRHVNALGAVTTYEYDELGNLTATTAPDETTTRYAYDAWCQPTTVTGPDGTTWQFAYDRRGNLTSRTDPTGAVTRYTYDERGHLAAVTDSLGQVTRIQSSLAGLPLLVNDPAGGETHYTYDVFGRLASAIDPAGGTTRYGWTIEGRPAWRITPTGAAERWTYDAEGNLTTNTDADGRTTRYEYTHFDLPSAQVGPDGARLEFTYDHDLRLTQVTNPQGLVWRYDYDPAGHLVAETDFNNHTLRYQRDAAGRLTRRINGAGQTIEYRRDPMGRILEQRTEDGVTTFTYDPAGRLLQAKNPHARLTYTYDPLGRVLTETCNDQTLTSTYNPVGQRTRQLTPAGVESSWDYDPAGRPATLRTGDHAFAFTHDVAGREVARTINDTITLTQQWNPDHHLTAQTIHGEHLPHPVQRTYTHTPAGQITAITDTLYGDRHLTLDPAGRITTVRHRDRAEHYTYDPAGNLTTATATAPADELLAASTGSREHTGTLVRRAGRITYTHDPQGRITTRRLRTLSGKVKQWTYTWDAEDHLTHVITPEGHHWHYRYDPLGRRITKTHYSPDTTPIEQTHFTWNATTLIEQRHRRGTKEQTTTWNYEPGIYRPTAQTQRITRPGEPVEERFHAIITDAIGTPNELISLDGTITPTTTPTIWGGGHPRSGGGATCPLRFPGQYHDHETGLNYNFHRYYDPTTAGYISPDPLGLDGGPNPHTYVPNPHLWSDPLGLISCDLNRRAAFRQAKRDLGIPMRQHPDSVTRVPMTDRNGNWVLGPDKQPIMTREYMYTRADGSNVVIQDHAAGHNYGEGGVGDQGSHFNVRPMENTRTGHVPGTEEHYPFRR